eukprot:TRINITY_DN2243_c0_g1_i2.p1 TRINITY_DN2243_c0_g1~~TRINITY_DN2243_c0_g1_i2.p1  ORF type:complete len:216 (-),score=23.04 TRINITY_DN2243_c0_g1_i2:40-687(-)
MQQTPPLSEVHVSSCEYAANCPCEDATVVHEDDKVVLVALFDGHGGVAAAHLGAERIYMTFSFCLRECRGNVGRALQESLVRLDTQYLELVDRHKKSTDLKVYLQYVGAGTCAVLLHLNKTNGSYHVANLGDSRIVLGKQCPHMSDLTEAIPLTADHSCKVDAERHQLRCRHPNDKKIVTERWDEVEFVWSLKGRAHETVLDLVCRLLLEKKKKK